MSRAAQAGRAGFAGSWLGLRRKSTAFWYAPCSLPVAAEREEIMARAQATLNQAERAVRSAVRNPWVERLARFGYAARGVVYALIGLLALQGGAIEQQATPQGALQRIAGQSRLLLVLVAIGLLGYALWRFVQAVLDTENKGDDAKGLASRGAMLASGIGYAGLALLAVRMVSGSSS